MKAATGTAGETAGLSPAGAPTAAGSDAGLAAPVLTGDLYLDAPLPDLGSEGRHTAARLLAWLHGRPVCEVVVPLGHQPLPAAELATRVWPLVAAEVSRHCADDGLPPPATLTAAGLTRPQHPPCAARRDTAGPHATVVIATRDRTQSLLRCLASVAALDYQRFDVVVADSAPSSDETATTLAAREWPFPLRYLHVPRPGLAVAHNAAMAVVTGEIVAFTDDDVEVEPGWLAALAGAFAATGAACVTGLILPAELETQAQLLVEQAGGFARGFIPRTYTRGMPDPDPLFPFTAGRFGSGANMAFRTEWLTAHGGFDAASGAGTPAKGGDDLIAFLRVITDGGTLAYEPGAVLRHWHRREYEGMRRQAFGYGVGLGAYLAASVWARPSLAAAMIGRTGPALRHLLSAKSEKNAGREAGFPPELVWRERAGVLTGPFAYGLSRWRSRGSRAGAEPVTGPR